MQDLLIEESDSLLSEDARRENYAAFVREKIAAYSSPPCLDEVCLPFGEISLQTYQKAVSTADLQSLGVTQFFSMTAVNPDSESPIESLHLTSTRNFVKVPRRTLPKLNSTRHQIFVLARTDQKHNDQQALLLGALKRSVPTAACVSSRSAGKGVTPLQIFTVIPSGDKLARRMDAAIVNRAGLLIGDYEGQDGIPPAFEKLCLSRLISKNPQINIAMLTLADQFLAYSKIEEILAPGQRPFSPKAAYPQPL